MGDKQIIERLSRAVTLTGLELRKDRDVLLPAYLMANIMSPMLWRWREKRRAHGPDGGLLSAGRRLHDLQRQFHQYSFTCFADQPGGDPWGLVDFAEEERRLGTEYVQSARCQIDAGLRHLLKRQPDSQFGRIVEQPYYRQGYFPRLRNETIELMNAYRGILEDGKASGKCAALALLWTAALPVCGRFSLDDVVLVGNRAHYYVFLDGDSNHVFNNGKWYNRTRLKNGSDLSMLAKFVATDTELVFLYCPSRGVWDCDKGTSEVPRQHLGRLLGTMEQFLGIPLKNPDLDRGRFSPSPCPTAIPDPLQYDSAWHYQQAVRRLADELPMSGFDFAQYAFRTLDVPLPQAYACAAIRDYHARQLAKGIRGLDDAIAIVENLTGNESLFDSRERLALPDETLTFHTGSDRDKALLLYTLLHHASAGQVDVAVGFSEATSYVRYGRTWVDMKSFSICPEPSDLRLVFDHEHQRRARDQAIPTCSLSAPDGLGKRKGGFGLLGRDNISLIYTGALNQNNPAD